MLFCSPASGTALCVPCKTFYPQIALQPHTDACSAEILILHLVVILLFFEIIILLVIIIVQLVARVLGCFGEVDGFTACAPAVADDVVRVNFLHVVVVFLFSCSHAGFS